MLTQEEKKKKEKGKGKEKRTGNGLTCFSLETTSSGNDFSGFPLSEFSFLFLIPMTFPVLGVKFDTTIAFAFLVCFSEFLRRISHILMYRG